MQDNEKNGKEPSFTDFPVPVLDLTDARRVVLVDCLVVGGRGADAGGLGYPGQDALGLRRSTAAVHRCELRGGNGGEGFEILGYCDGGYGGSAVHVIGSSFLYASGGDLIRGKGGPGCYTNGLPGYSIILESGAEAHLLGVTLLGATVGRPTILPSSARRMQAAALGVEGTVAELNTEWRTRPHILGGLVRHSSPTGFRGAARAVLSCRRRAEGSATPYRAPVQPPERAFLIRVAELLHRYGTPAHRLERVLHKLAGVLGVRASFLSTPTSLIASFGEREEERTHLLRVEPGEVDLGKLIEFDEVMEDVEDGRSGVADALERLERVAAAGPRYPAPLTAFAFGLASAAAARFFGGGAGDVALSFVLGPLIYLLGRLLGRRPAAVGVYEPAAAFLAASAALVAARLALPVDDRIVTLGSLIVLIPGLTLTVGLTELATRHLVSGTARMAGAASVFLTLLLGVALAWRIGELALPAASAGPGPFAPLPDWTTWIALAIAPLAFCVILEARPREIGVIHVTGVAGFLAARTAATAFGADLGAFLGALVVGIASNLYARLLDRPALVPSTPAILLLVPGSLGYRSLTSFLARESLAGMEWAFQMSLIAVSLVGGLLVANLVVPPRRVL